MEHDEKIQKTGSDLERLANERGIDLDSLCKKASQALGQWEHLREFGYAPGNYVIYCYDCRSNVVADKRATKCLSCATKLYINVINKESWPILDLDKKRDE